MKHLVIFDLDGTLLNTIDDLGTATNHALTQCGYPTHSPASYPMLVGNGVTRLMERAMPEDMRTPANTAAMLGHFRAYYDAHLADTTLPYEGIHDMLRTLCGMDVKVAVASNKYQSAVERLVAHFFPDIPWSAVHGHRDGVPSKPDPSIVFSILGEVPTRKSKVLYCGDSGVDMETARRACVDSVGVTWGFRPLRELREAHADNIADTPAGIIDIVRRPGLQLD